MRDAARGPQALQVRVVHDEELTSSIASDLGPVTSQAPPPFGPQRLRPPSRQRPSLLPARRLLGRLTLLGADETITSQHVEVLANDASPEYLEQLLTELVRTGWLAPIDGGYQRVVTADWEDAAQLFAEEVVDDPGLSTHLLLELRRSAANRQPRSRLVRDFWTIEDQLGRSRYATALAEFIRHPQSRPPLVVALRGDWGAGKTSLMRMIQADLDDIDAEGRLRRIELSPTVPALLRWRRRRGAAPAASESVSNAEVLRNLTKAASPEITHEAAGETGRWRPTVWFNPWMYQKSEQVWAGLADSIIEQVTSRMATGERERFWLRLNLRRLDVLAVRRRAYRLILQKLVPAFFVAVLILAFAALASLFHFADGIFRWSAVASFAVLAGGGLVSTARFLLAPAARTFGQAVSQPTPGQIARGTWETGGTLLGDALSDYNYRAQTGSFACANRDIADVLGLVARPDQPLVVFIDDLDRCSPAVVVEVIEALNIFLAGQLENCMFVLAIEPHVIAAHIDVAYREVGERLENHSKNEQFGWRFLEKIIQLPVGLPTLDSDETMDQYLRALVGDERIRRAPEPMAAATPSSRSPSLRSPMPSAKSVVPAEDLVCAAEEALRAQRPNSTSLFDSAERLFDTHPELGRPAIDAAVLRVLGDVLTAEEAFDAIASLAASVQLDNPREIKRYLNLYRFYSFLLFGTYRQVEPIVVAKLAMIALRWPFLIERLVARTEAGATVLDVLEQAASDVGTWNALLIEHRIQLSTLQSVRLRMLLNSEPSIAKDARQIF
ncbi:KAP family P-loop domain-containing protein [Amycolatopsis xylanica]|uniref:KAP family P-loop domain-containing protein n=1 Tax=Amycolatopsis xylanica TaxID=589385 RepID=A0A1H3S433_9PSEU|nr:KAP family P-loop domain-containing protein [Amycolatopsis xylanica]